MNYRVNQRLITGYLHEKHEYDIFLKILVKDKVIDG